MTAPRVTRRRLIGAASFALAGSMLPPSRANASSIQPNAFQTWQRSLRIRLAQHLVMPPVSSAELNASVDADAPVNGHPTWRIGFNTEPGERVTGYLSLPEARRRGPLPVMICLQGHTPGVHLSIGRPKTPEEAQSILGGRDLAVQALANGWAAVAIEQRAFGTRAEPGVACMDASLRALLKGRPMTGQRVADLSRTIDFIRTRPELDHNRIGVVGNSAGGTVAFYAACLDPRVALAVVSCSFCTFADSWLSLPHCACGYVPGLAALSDMPELAGLIAPRKLLIVAGREDPLAKLKGVEEGFRTAQRLFASAGALDRVRLVVGNGGHQFYPDLAWSHINATLR